MGDLQPLIRNPYNGYINTYYWVDEFIPYYMEIMGVDRPKRHQWMDPWGWYIYLHLYGKSMVNVGKYSVRPMDSMGCEKCHVKHVFF